MAGGHGSLKMGAGQTGSAFIPSGMSFGLGSCAVPRLPKLIAPATTAIPDIAQVRFLMAASSNDGTLTHSYRHRAQYIRSGPP